MVRGELRERISLARLRGLSKHLALLVPDSRSRARYGRQDWLIWFYGKFPNENIMEENIVGIFSGWLLIVDTLVVWASPGR